MSNIESAYRRFIDRRFPLPSEQQVVDLEYRLGVKLPPEYRNYILSYNGGYFLEPTLELRWGEDALNVLYGINASHPSAELGSNIYLFGDNDPVSVLPIGYTVMGNLIYTFTFPEEYGPVGVKKAYANEYFTCTQSLEEFFGILK